MITIFYPPHKFTNPPPEPSYPISGKVKWALGSFFCSYFFEASSGTLHARRDCKEGYYDAKAKNKFSAMHVYYYDKRKSF